MLSQKQSDDTICPIAYASRTLQPHERNYGISELEALGVVWAVKHFRHYIYGHQCTVYTDHEALKSLLNTPQPSGKLARWGMALQELDLDIQYHPGGANARADALSRYPVPLLAEDCIKTQTPALIAALEIPAQSGEGGYTEATLSERQLEDPQLQEIIKYLLDGELPTDDRRARQLVLSQSDFTVYLPKKPEGVGIVVTVTNPGIRFVLLMIKPQHAAEPVLVHTHKHYPWSMAHTISEPKLAVHAAVLIVYICTCMHTLQEPLMLWELTMVVQTKPPPSNRH